MIIQDANLKDFLVRKDNARMGARESLVYIRAQRMTDELNPARVRPSHRAPPWTTTRPTHSTSARSPRSIAQLPGTIRGATRRGQPLVLRRRLVCAPILGARGSSAVAQRPTPVPMCQPDCQARSGRPPPGGGGSQSGAAFAEKPSADLVLCRVRAAGEGGWIAANL